MNVSIEIDPKSSPVVEQLWDAIEKAITYASSPTNPLLTTVGSWQRSVAIVLHLIISHRSAGKIRRISTKAFFVW